MAKHKEERRGGSRWGSEWTRRKPEVYKLTVAHMETLIRLLIIGVLLAIVASLGSALFHLTRYTKASRRRARVLPLLLGLSVALFVLLMLAWHFGLIAPHGLASSAHP